jgi:hypothetical protein
MSVEKYAPLNTSQKLMALRQQSKQLRADPGKLNASMNDLSRQVENSRLAESSLLADYRRILDAIDEPSQPSLSNKLRERRSESKKRQLRSHLESRAQLDISGTAEKILSPERTKSKYIPINCSPLSEKDSPAEKQDSPAEDKSSSNVWESEGKIRESLAEKKCTGHPAKFSANPAEPSILQGVQETNTHRFDSDVHFLNGKWEINGEASPNISPKKSPTKEKLIVEPARHSHEHILNNIPKKNEVLSSKRYDSSRRDKENLHNKLGSITERIQVVSKTSKYLEKDGSKRVLQYASKSPLQTAIHRQNVAAESSARAELFSKLERFNRQIEKLKANFDVISPFLVSSHLDGSLQFDKEIKHELQVIERKIKAFSGRRF